MVAAFLLAVFLKTVSSNLTGVSCLVMSADLIPTVLNPMIMI